jgi:hypothetical protein
MLIKLYTQQLLKESPKLVEDLEKTRQSLSMSDVAYVKLLATFQEAETTSPVPTPAPVATRIPASVIPHVVPLMGEVEEKAAAAVAVAVKTVAATPAPALPKKTAPKARATTSFAEAAAQPAVQSADAPPAPETVVRPRVRSTTRKPAPKVDMRKLVAPAVKPGLKLRQNAFRERGELELVYPDKIQTLATESVTPLQHQFHHNGAEDCLVAEVVQELDENAVIARILNSGPHCNKHVVINLWGEDVKCTSDLMREQNVLPVGWYVSGKLEPLATPFSADVTFAEETREVTITERLLNVTGAFGAPTFIECVANTFVNRNTTQLRHLLKVLADDQSSRVPYLDATLLPEMSPTCVTSLLAANPANPNVHDGVVLWFGNELDGTTAMGHIMITTGPYRGMTVLVQHNNLVYKGHMIRDHLAHLKANGVRADGDDTKNFFGTILFPGELVSFTLEKNPEPPRRKPQPNTYHGLATNVCGFRGAPLFSERTLRANTGAYTQVHAAVSAFIYSLFEAMVSDSDHKSPITIHNLVDESRATITFDSFSRTDAEATLAASVDAHNVSIPPQPTRRAEASSDGFQTQQRRSKSNKRSTHRE